MKRITKMSALLAVAAAAPAVVTPQLVSSAHAQAEFQDVPTTHWAYPALQKLAAAGVLEGYPPTGNYIGQRPMTRYEFAVAIARILDKMTPNVVTPPNDVNLQPLIDKNAQQDAAIAALQARPVPDINRAQVLDLIDQLRREFRDELARLGARVDVLEGRVTTLENRVTPAPRLTIAPSILHRTGYASYIDNSGVTLNPGGNPGGVSGRTFLGGGVGGNDAALPFAFRAQRFQDSGAPSDSYADSVANRKFSYTDFEVRLTDRVSDRLSLSAALRSLGSNQEDPWVGDSGGNIYVREAYATADISDRKFLGVAGGSVTLGRQRDSVGLGLLYDNQLSPTDQLKADFRVGPVNLTGFVGTMNNVAVANGGSNSLGGLNDPYGSQGSIFYLDAGSDAQALNTGFASNATTFTPADDNESLLRASANLFRISGRPVAVGYNHMFDGFRAEKGDSVDLSLPLFNRTIGIEYVRQGQQANGADTDDIAGGRPHAMYANVNLLRTSIVDVNVGYGHAEDNFQYFAASAANPYARSYGEALFDRPLALGAPMINPSAPGAGEPLFVAAKRAFDVTGTLRVPFSVLRRIPIDFRYFQADGTNQDGDSVALGNVVTVGTKFNLTPGVDLEVKSGFYNPRGNISNINYLRVGASVGF